MKRNAAKKMIAITPAAVPESSFTWKCLWLKSQPKKEVDRWSCDTSRAGSSELLIGRGEKQVFCQSARAVQVFSYFLNRKREPGRDRRLGRTVARETPDSSDAPVARESHRRSTHPARSGKARRPSTAPS